MIKRVDVMIWKSLVEDIGGYVSTTTICCDLGMSRRQLLTRVTKLNFPYVEKSTEKFCDGGHVDSEVYFRLTCTPQEAQEFTEKMLSDYFGCEKSAVEKVLLGVPTDKSITLDEVSYPKELFSTKDLIYILSVSPCIETIKTWTKNRYLRKDMNVQQCV